jgi:hypothetical protein
MIRNANMIRQIKINNNKSIYIQEIINNNELIKLIKLI